PQVGWLVEGGLELVDAGSPSKVIIHVCITDLGDQRRVDGGKEGVSASSAAYGRHGRIIYACDVSASSRGTGAFGSITAPGTGNPVPFDFRNAAERIYHVLTPDAFRYGFRNSPTQRQ